MEINLSNQEYEIKKLKRSSNGTIARMLKKIDRFAYKNGGFYFIFGVCLFFQLFLDLFLLKGGITERLQWGANTAPIPQVEWFRFITAMFLHGGFIHLFVNMLSLYYLSKQVLEQIWDPVKAFLAFFISALFANIISFVLRIEAPSLITSVGASGGVFGLMGALLAYYSFNKSLSRQAKKFYTKQIFSILIFNLIIGLLVPNIDMLGHMLGFASGFLIGFFIERLPYSFYKQRKGFWSFIWFITVVIMLSSFITATISYWKVALQ